MRDISSPRWAKSFLTPGPGVAVVEGVFDFQLGPRMGVAVMDVLGWPKTLDVSALTGALGTHPYTSSLHLETGTLEVPNVAASDETIIDSEIFYIQIATLGGISLAGAAGMTVWVAPSGLVHYDPPVLTARNITHRVQSEVANGSIEAGILMRYKFVEFTLEEMGLLLSLRS